MNQLDLTKRVAIVTGAAQGIGFSVARRLLQSGASVALWDLDAAALEKAKLELEALGAVTIETVNVADPESVDIATEATLQKKNSIDILVANAGIAGPNHPTWEYPVDAWKQVLDINLTGVFLSCRAVMPIMLRQKYGRIVNVASIAGKEGNPNASAYSASKAGVIALTKSLGKETAGLNIAVNCVTPAAARTRIFDQMTPEFIDYMLSKIPRGRFLEVDEVSAMIAWLVSEENSFTTAAVFDLSGGRANVLTRHTTQERTMKLLRYGKKGAERPGLLDDNGVLRDLSSLVSDLDNTTLSPELLLRLQALDSSQLPAVAGSPRIGPCVGKVGKFICVGLNYSDHAAESGMAVPAEPVLFMKATSSIMGPNDDVILPRQSTKSDWEVELGVVIGREARYVAESDALSYVAGYCVVNDLSERAFQLEGTGQWVKGKSADTFGPVGPWLVTVDEVPDPQDLTLWLEVDGQQYQHGSSRTMVFGVAALVSYISRFMSLQPGDIVSTGTPPGVGLGQKPPVYLREGNRMRLGIDGLGEQQQLVKTENE